jgi:hypothetical protein
MLRRMNKGGITRQHVHLLRYARSAGFQLTWRVRYDFPGDQLADYESTLAVIPLLRHLTPPAELDSAVGIDRFSRYFSDPAAFGITNIRPIESYRLVYPDHADLDCLAYYFEGDYSSAHRDHPNLGPRLERALSEWQDAWRQSESAFPALTISPVDQDTYLLMDTRELEGMGTFAFLTREQARAALAGGPVSRQSLHGWAVDRKLAVEMDGWSVPLAVADAATLRHVGAGLHIDSAESNGDQSCRHHS